MKSVVAGCAVLFVCAATVYAADEPAPAVPGEKSAFGGYTSLRLEEAGVFVGGFDGTIERLSDGVRITLLSDDPELKPLPISAREMKFSWDKDVEGKPTKILIEGKVAIEHPDATVRAERAEWDLIKGILEFTGSPVITNARAPQGMEGQKVVLDFNTNKFYVYGGRAKEIPFGQSLSGSTADPYLLREQDIVDWPKFLEMIKTQSADAAASPGKRIFSLLDPKVQKLLTTTGTETLLADKPALVKQLNRVMANPKLYSSEAWAGVALDPGTKALVDQGSQAPVTRLNRALMAAAFPGLIAAAPREKE